MEDYETNSMHYAREELLQAWLGRFVRLNNEYPRIQIQYPCDICGFLDSLFCDSYIGKLIAYCMLRMLKNNLQLVNSRAET